VQLAEEVSGLFALELVDLLHLGLFEQLGVVIEP